MLRGLQWLMLWTGCGAGCVAVASPETCSYSTYQWNVIEKRAVHRQRVEHPYSQLEPREVDPLTGCTVCEQDQVTIKLEGIAPFKICHVLAAEVKQILQQQLVQGQYLNKVVGYRVGMTKGPLDDSGSRTRFSYHSFGIALDINEQDNGLYDNCLSFDSRCRLLRGGRWDPRQPGSLSRDHPLVRAFKRMGLKWGGEIAGKQKDFMHFSPYGY